MSPFLTIAARNILQAKRRSFWLATALGVVSMFLVLLMALSQGITDTMLRSATILMSGHVNVGGFYKFKPDLSAPIVQPVDALRRLVRENTPGLDTVIDRGRGWSRIVSETSSLYSGILAVDVREETQLRERVLLAKESEYKDGGRDTVLGDIQDLAEPNTLLIFAAQAKRLRVTVGDVVTLTTETPDGQVNTADLRVAAIGSDLGFMSGWSAFIPKQTLREIYQIAPDVSGAVMVYLKDPKRAAEVAQHLRGVLARNGYALLDHQAQPFWMKFETVNSEDWTGLKLDVTTWEDEVGMMKWAIGALDSISLFLVVVLVVIIVVGIMNAMWMAVRERTQEIGTLRAIGMQRRQVLRMFLTEAALLGAAATSAGALVGALLAVSITAAEINVTIEAVRFILMTDVLRLATRPENVLLAVAAFTLVTVLATLWPASAAARLQPVTAIHRAE